MLNRITQILISALLCISALYSVAAEVHTYPAGTYTSKENLLAKVPAKQGDIIDCRNAVFHQDNSNQLGANYPCKLENCPGDVTIRYARVIGHAPYNIAWQTQYNKGNSSAISVFYGGGATFQDCFVGGPEKANNCVWDYFRFARQGGEIRNYIKDCAFILGRDDGETDTGLKNLTIENTLFYVYVGISSRPGGGRTGNATHRDITIRNCVMRMFHCIGNTSKYGSAPIHGAPFKWRTGSQKYIIHDFVVGAGWPGGGKGQAFKSGQWRSNWSGALGYIKEATGDNVFCYLDDDGFDNAVPLGPFRLLEGKEAREYLSQKVRDWVNAHEYWKEIWPDFQTTIVQNVLADIDPNPSSIADGITNHGGGIRQQSRSALLEETAGQHLPQAEIYTIRGRKVTAGRINQLPGAGIYIQRATAVQPDWYLVQ